MNSRISQERPVPLIQGFKIDITTQLTDTDSVVNMARSQPQNAAFLYGPRTIMPEAKNTHLELVSDPTDHSELDDKLSKFVQLAEEVKPAEVEQTAILKIAELAHSLVGEVSDHFKAQDKRIAELEAITTTDELTSVLNKRGFES